MNTCVKILPFRRHRFQEKKSDYAVDPTSVKINETGIQAILTSEVNKLKLEIVLLEDSTVRILIDEAGTPLRPRFQPLDALDGPPKHAK